MEDDDLLTSVEVARLLRIHPKHLYRLIRKGLPGLRVGQGNWRFRRQEVIAWFEARRRPNTAGEGVIEVQIAGRAQPAERWLVARIGDRWIGHAMRTDHAHAADAFSPKGDAMAEGTAYVTPSRPLVALSANMLVAGCAPLLGVVLDRLEEVREHGRAHWLPTNSTESLHWLRDGFVHIAGIHLADAANGTTHADLVARLLPRRAFHLVHLVRWRLGLAIAKGNPKSIAGVQDLARPDLRVALREEGSGVQQTLDRALEHAGLRRDQMVHTRTLRDHRSVAQAVAFGALDVGMTVESAAMEADLQFLPLAEEAFDLVLPVDLTRDPAVERTLEALDSRILGRELSTLGPYDTRQIGHVETVVASGS